MMLGAMWGMFAAAQPYRAGSGDALTPLDDARGV
jgi:hypothetical protein